MSIQTAHELYFMIKGDNVSSSCLIEWDKLSVPACPFNNGYKPIEFKATLDNGEEDCPKVQNVIVDGLKNTIVFTKPLDTKLRGLHLWAFYNL